MLPELELRTIQIRQNEEARDSDLVRRPRRRGQTLASLEIMGWLIESNTVSLSI